MVIAPCITFHGACKNALNFYADVFPATQKEVQIFREVDSELRTYVTPENENYILQARLQFSCGTTLVLKDSTSLFLAAKSTEDSGCKDGPIIDVFNLSLNEIQALYSKFMDIGSTSNIAIAPRGIYTLYASLIDPFGICWNFYCENTVNEI